jgi:hypothetical protein
MKKIKNRFKKNGKFVVPAMVKRVSGKTISWILLFTVAVWTLSVQLGDWAPFAGAVVSNTVQFDGCGPNMDEPCFWIPPNGEVLPASSEPAPLFSFRLAKSSAATLTSIKVNLIAPTTDSDSNPIDLSTNPIGSLRVYRQTTFSEGMYSFPDNERIDDGNTVISDGDFSAVGGQQIASYTITIASSGTHADTNDKNFIPDDFWSGGEYIVALTTNANWDNNDQIAYSLPADWITVSDGTLGDAFSGQQSTDVYYATAPSGWVGDTFAVEMVEDMGTMGDGTKEVEVRFTTDVDEASATTKANYSINGTVPIEATTMSPRDVRLVFANSVTITPNQTALTIYGPGGATVNGKVGVQDIKGNIFNADVIMVIMGGGGPGSASVLISEVMIGTATSGQEEFIELYNPSGNPIDLSASNIKVWSIYSSGSGITHTKIADLNNGTIQPNGYYLVAAAEYSGISPAADKTYSISGLGLGTEGALKLDSGIYLSFSDTQDMAVFDRLGWGSAMGEMSDGPAKCDTADPDNCIVANDGKSLERKANSAATAATMASGGADENNGNSYMSGNNEFDFVQQATPNPQNASSPAESPGGSGFGENNNPPSIFHQPLFMGIAGSDLIGIADVGDDSGDLSSSNVKLFYRDNNPQGSWNELASTKNGPGSFKFTIPSSALDVDKDLDYYIRAYDGSKYSCMPGPCDADTGNLDGSATFNYVDITTSTGTGVVSGFVRDSSGNGISDVTVFLEGSPFTGSTNSSGAFTISDVADGIYRLRVPGGTYTSNGESKNYIEGWIDGISINSNNTTSSNNIIVLIEGMGGQGGDMETPLIMWSAPMDQMMGAPTTIDINSTFIEMPMLLGFSKPMDSTTINSTNITVKPMTASGLGSAHSICVVYQEQDSTVDLTSQSGSCARAGVSSVEFGPDQKAIIYSDTPLDPNMQYVIEITGAVRDNAGNPLQGKRPGGGDTIAFTTSAGDFGGMFGGESQTTTFFKDGQEFTFDAERDFASGGKFMPPYVTATIPAPGSQNVPIDTKILITFSEPMSSASITTSTIVLYDTTAGQNVSLTSVSLDNSKTLVTVTPATNLTANHNYAIRVLGAAQSTSGIYMAKPDTGYETRIMHQTDFTAGSSADTDQPTVLGSSLEMYEVNGSIVDVPNSVGVIEIGFSEDMDVSTISAATVTLKSGTSTVSTVVTYDGPSRTIQITPTNVLYTNTNYTLTVTSGANGVRALNGSGTANQLAADWTQTFTTSSDIDTAAPSVIFANGDDYTLAITFSESMKAVTAVDTNNWANSVLNPANYILYTDDGPPPAGNTAKYFAQNDLSTVVDSASGGPVTFKYDAPSNTVVIEGLRMMDSALSVTGGFRVWVRNVADLSGNVITANGTTTTSSWTPSSVNDFYENAAGGGVMNSTDTFGMIGPGGGGMMGPPPDAMFTDGFGAGPAMDFGGKNVHDMGFEPIGVWPMNMQAGAESMYMIDIPISSALSDGDKIVLTFPQGFDVRGAKSGDPNNNWAHQDINGPGPGTITLKTSGISADSASATQGGLQNDGVVINASARTVTMHLNISGNGGSTGSRDFLHFEIDGIKNSPTAKDFDTAGYSVDIKTQSGTTGRVIESKTSMPFFLQPKGNITLTVTVNFKDTSGNAASVTKSDLRIFLMSPMSGPMKQSQDFSNESSKTYTFTDLNAGFYDLMSEPVYTVGSTDYYSDRGDPRPFEIAANNDNCTNSACTATINLQAEDTSSRPQVTVYLIGAFSSDDIDIFAGGPGGFRVKTIDDLTATCTAANAHTETGCSYTLSLPGTGTFMVGMGPAMPHGPEMMGPPPMPNWMPPPPVEVTVTGSGGNWTWADSAGAADDDTTAADGKITISIATADKTITGYVCKTLNADGTACATDGQVASAEIFAHSPMGGFGTNASSDPSDGSFSLPVQEGFYKVGAFLPGMPPSQEKSVDIRGSKMYVDGIEATNVILKVKVPDYTISGKVTDGNNVVKGAGVFAYRTDGPGGADAMTDSTGKYILYVNPGTWKVGAFIPGFGQLPPDSELTITITDQSKTSQNLSPPTSSTNFDFITIEDRVYKDINGNGSYDAGTDTPLSGVHVVAEGTNFVNDAMTDENGLYSLKVPTDPSGTNLSDYQYDIKAWSPTLGKLPIAENVSSATDISADGSADIPVPDSKTVTVNFIDEQSNPVSLTTAFVQFDKIGTKGVRNDIKVSDKSSITIELPKDATCNTTTGAGCYALDIDIPGISEQAFEADKISGADSNTTVVGKDIDGASASTKEMYIVDVDGNETINVVVPTLYTISGTVKDDSGNAVPDAIVHIEKPGTEVELDIKADSSGNYTVELPASGDTPYLIQADKVGYLDTASSLEVTGDNSSANLVVDAATTTISGTVKVGSTGVDKATVIIEQLGGGFTTTQTDADGNYTVKVPAGDYKVRAAAEGYTESYHEENSQTAVVSTTSGNATAKDVTLSTTKSGLDTPPAELVTPQSGGSIEHTSTTGVGITMSPGTLGSATTDYRVTDKDTSNVPMSTPTANVIGDEGKDVTASYQTSSGSQISVQDLDDDMSLELTYTIAELTAEGIDTFDEVENMKVAYFDDTARNWSSLPTNITFLGTGSDADTVVIPAADLSNVGKVIMAGKTDHMTVFGATNPSPDGLAPKAPTGVTATGGSSSITISWIAPTQNTDDSTLTDLLGYEIYRSTSANGTYTQLNSSDITTTSYTDSTAVSGTTYYYKVTAADTGGIESAMSSSDSASLAATSGGTSPGGGGDSIAPSISDISVARGTTTATISWATNESSLTWVLYGPDTNYGGEIKTTGYTTSHTVTITGLSPETSYHYMIKTKDSRGNSASYTDQVFITKAEGQQSDTSDEPETTGAVETPEDEEPAETTKTADQTITEKAKEFAQKIVTIVSEAVEVIKANLNSLLAKIGIRRNLDKENFALSRAIKLVKGVPAVNKRQQDAIIHFISYGTSTTQKLGEGERAGVLNSYKSAFNKLPKSQDEWADAIKIANGRWPTQRSENKEAEANASFKKIYLREPDRSNPNDDAAIVVMAYGLRPTTRNLESERRAITIFESIYNYSPESATDWDIVRAIAYSGATR